MTTGHGGKPHTGTAAFFVISFVTVIVYLIEGLIIESGNIA